MLASSCGGTSSDPTTAGGDETVEVSASERLPADDLVDWVSYADAVVAVTVTGEAELAPTEEESAAGEGLLLRDVTLQVDDVLWSHPTLSGLPAEPFTFTTIGWLFGDGQRTPAVSGGAVRLEVGRRYVMPVTYWDDDEQWGPTAPSAVLALDADGRVAAAEDAGDGAEDSLAALSDRPVADLAEELAATEPHPVAEANRNLDPVARFNAVEAAEG
jgi:hypothetical protein